MKLLRKAGVALLCAAAALGSALWQPQVLQGLRHAQFDQFQRWQPRPYVADQVLVVDIDDDSLRRLGQWPWPRTQLADLVAVLQSQGAVVIGLDALLVEPDRTSPRAAAAQWRLAAPLREALEALPDHDAVLARRLAQAPVVLGMVLGQGAAANASGLRGLPDALPYRVVQQGELAVQGLHAFEGATLPLPGLLQASRGVGALNFIPDPDGVVRRVPLLLSVQGQVAPSLVAEMARVALGARNYVLQALSPPGRGLEALRMGPVTVPSTTEGEMWLHYSAPAPERFESAWKVLAGQTDPQRIAGKLVLVGTSAQGLMDLRFSAQGEIVPGVAIHAQALEQLLAGQYLQRPAWAPGLEAMVAVLGCLLVGLLAMGTGAAWSALAVAALVSATLAGAWWAFSGAQLLLNGVEPVVWMLLTFLLCSVLRHLATEREQRWIRQAFARYVSPNRVEHLVRNPEQLELGGKRQECSFIFADLAGFTTLMDGLDPARAVVLLNAYLDRMVGIAFEHGGTLDRIMGDAVAIMFSAPLQQSDHRERALRCALAMDAFAQAYAQRIQSEQGLAFGFTRIGVHTGEVIVGNFGGTTLFDYRALGDAVNTASRLEGANKYLGTRLCVSEATLVACPEVEARPVAHLVLKGKSQVLAVWEPCLAQPPGCAPTPVYLDAYQALQAFDPNAMQAFEALAARYPRDGVVAMHLQRLQRGETGVQLVLHDK